jgi:hypothetical protein
MPVWLFLPLQGVYHRISQIQLIISLSCLVGLGLAFIGIQHFLRLYSIAQSGLLS